MSSNADLLHDKFGNVVTVFHGTYYDFDYFFPLSHFGNKVSAQTVLKEGKWKRDKNIDITKPKIISAHLRNGNYPEIPDLNDHYAKDWQAIVLAYLLDASIITDINVLKKWDDIQTKCEQACVKPLPYQYDFISEPLDHGYDDDLVRRELSMESLYDKPTCDNLFFQRMIRFFESVGISGFSYSNFTESGGDNSYIIFRQNNVQRTDKEVPPMCTNVKTAVLDEIEWEYKNMYIVRKLTDQEKNAWIKKLHDFYDFRTSEMAKKKTKNEILEKSKTIIK